MKLRNFTGGINTAEAPHMLTESNSVNLENISLNKSSLKSVKSLKNIVVTDVDGNVTPMGFYSFYNGDTLYTSNAKRAYKKVINSVYIKEENNSLLVDSGTGVRVVGLPKPTTTPAAALNGTGEILGPDSSIPVASGALSEALNPIGDHIAFGSATSPYLEVKKYVTGQLTAIQIADLPAAAVVSIEYSSDGVYLAATTASDVHIYRRYNDNYVRIQTWSQGFTITSLCWGGSDVYLAVVGGLNVKIYKRAGDVFTVLTDPPTMPVSGVLKDCVFTATGLHLIVGLSVTPFIQIWKRSGDTFTKLSNPASLPAAAASRFSLTPLSDYVAMAVADGTERFAMYSISGDTYTKLSNPAGTYGEVQDVQFNPAGTQLLMVRTGTADVYVFERVGSTLVLKTSAWPTSAQKERVRWSPGGSEIYAYSSTDPRFEVFTYNVGVYAKKEILTAVSYVYTLYDSVTGVESVPSDPSNELILGPGYSVDISNMSFVYTADTIRIYRIGPYTTEYVLIAEIAPAATYNDNIVVNEEIGDLLDSQQYEQPPITAFGLEYYNTMLFMCDGSELRFSIPGQPEYWPAVNSINFGQPLTGLLAFNGGLLVFLETETHIVTGDDPSNLSKVQLSRSYGCNNYLTTEIVKSTPVWSSSEGICYLNGLQIENLTERYLDKDFDFSALIAESTSSVYYLALLDERLLLIDFITGAPRLSFKTYQDKISSCVFKDNKMLFISSSKLFEESEDLLDVIRYTSPEFDEGDASVVKLYNQVYLAGTGDFNIKVYIDDEVVSEYSGKIEYVKEIKIPAELQRGSKIQFEIEGRGELRELEYKVQGRDNGR
jgi:hypothetical protein